MFKLIEKLLVFEASKIFYRGSKKMPIFKFFRCCGRPGKGQNLLWLLRWPESNFE